MPIASQLKLLDHNPNSGWLEVHANVIDTF